MIQHRPGAHRFAGLQAGRLEHHSKRPAAHHALCAVVDCLAVGPGASCRADHMPRGIGVSLYNTTLKNLQTAGAPSGAVLRCLSSTEGACLLLRAALNVGLCTLKLPAGSAASRAQEAGVLQQGRGACRAAAALQLLQALSCWPRPGPVDRRCDAGKPSVSGCEAGAVSGHQTKIGGRCRQDGQMVSRLEVFMQLGTETQDRRHCSTATG